MWLLEPSVASPRMVSAPCRFSWVPMKKMLVVTIEDLDERPAAVGLDVTLGEDDHDRRRVEQGL